MNLSKPTLTDLKKVTVKIICGNNGTNEGSGILLMVDDVLYVLTAAHVIESEDKDVPLDSKQLRVYMIKNSSEYNFPVEKVILFNKTTDAAVLRVNNIDSMPVKGLDKVRILTQTVDGPALLCGFYKNQQSPKQYMVERRGDDIWGVMEIQLNVQPLQCDTNFSGYSGGGVFYCDADKVLYITAYMHGVGSHSGNNNEFVCYPAANFCESQVLKPLVDKRQYDYIADSGIASSYESKLCLKPLDKSAYGEKHKGAFIRSRKLTDIIEQLKDDEKMTILLTALSGMGKSRLIYEAFKGTEQQPNRYYTQFAENRTDILGELTTILRSHNDEDGIIIVDDCPMDFIPELISRRNGENSQFRLIFANHDFFSEELAYNKSDYTVIPISPNDVKEDVDRYISEILNEDEGNKNDTEEIKKLAGGYPQMAIELVNVYQKEHVTDPDAVSHLMPKLLNLTAGQEKEEKAIWQTLSLCMPFPYQDASHEGFKYMITENHFTPLNTMDFVDRRSLAAKIINKYKPTLIDLIGQWLYVRPFPLAVWLTSEWFRSVCNTNDHFKELIDSIQKQPEWVQNSISEGFCKHIQQMHGNKAAFEMVEKLVNADINAPFFNEEVLCSGLGSKLFLAMSSVNPAAIASCIKRVLSQKDIEWLENKFNGDGRRNVVWALEKLCFAKESYHDAIMVLARLAVAENESIGNNAIGQLTQLFHIYLAGTEVDLHERFWALEQLINKENTFTPIVIKCFGAAFRNGDFMRMGGAEKFGYENKRDYMPNNREVVEYWYGCRDLLLKWLDEHPEIAEALSEMIEERTFQWVRSGSKDIFIPLLDKVAAIKEYHWDKEYEALVKAFGTFNLDASVFGVEDIMKKLRNNSFITRIKEARYQLYGQYHLKEDDRIKLTSRLFEPLAEDFVQNGLFSNTEELKAILEDKEYIPIDFIRKVLSILDAHQLELLFSVLLKVIDGEAKDFYSPFLGNLCFESKENEFCKDFLHQLKKIGRESLYVSLMGCTENEELAHFKELYKEQQNGELKEDFLTTYLRFYRTYDNGQYLTMLKALRQYFPDRPNSLIAYVISERFMMKTDERPEVVAIIKKALLEYHLDCDHDRLLSDYTRILIETLQNWHDSDFAKKINKKMIEAYNTQMMHLSSEGIFTELLKEYLDDIWVDFISALLAPETFLFYFQVKDEIGSGYGFGQGPLFNVDERKIKQLCFDHPDSAPNRIASMAPCFDQVEDGKDANQFSQWFLWLLDNFGKQKEVRESISANLGSFSWKGSMILYYKRNIRCFNNLLDHKIAEVRNWAQSNINDNQKFLDMEQSNEDFMHIRYEL